MRFALVFVFDLAFLYSRSALVAVGATYGALTVVELWKLKTRRLTIVTVAGLFLVIAVLVVSPARTRSLVELWNGPMYGYDTRSRSRPGSPFGLGRPCSFGITPGLVWGRATTRTLHAHYRSRPRRRSIRIRCSHTTLTPTT